MKSPSDPLIAIQAASSFCEGVAILHSRDTARRLVSEMWRTPTIDGAALLIDLASAIVTVERAYTNRIDP